MPQAPSISFAEKQLFTSDFDKSYALTSEPAPNGMTVELGYEDGVRSIFGDFALARYRAEGGLRNRAPLEIVAQLAPHLDPSDQVQRSEDLVQIKLGHLYSQVGQRLPDGSIWPRIVPGFSATWQKLHASAYVDTAVISSGHRSFITRFHEVHEVPQPDAMVTDDDMRPLMIHIPPELCMKPGRLLIDIVHHKWLAMNGVTTDYSTLENTRAQITYAGDNGGNKDRHVAENAGVNFIPIDVNDYAEDWARIGRLILPSDFEQALTA